MPAEHYRKNAEGKIGLYQGYFCERCGEPCSMMGHKECSPNPELVAKIKELNR